MQSCASKKRNLTDWIMCPVKIYIIVSLPFYFLFREFYPHPLWTNIGNNTSILDPLAADLLDIFIVCAPALWLGAVIQFISKNNKAGICALLFSVAPSLVLMSLIFLWVIAHLL
jgi:hypothetical protein